MTVAISTLADALLLIGTTPATLQDKDGPLEPLPVTSCGVHRDGRLWIGFGSAPNDGSREVVAPALVFFLPIEISTGKSEGA